MKKGKTETVMETHTERKENHLPRYARDVLMEDSRKRIKDLEETVKELAQKLERMYNQLQYQNLID